MRVYRLAVLFIVVLTGCQVPDVQPFAEATASMSSAVKTSLQQVSTDFQRLDSLNPKAFAKSQQDSLGAYQKRLTSATVAFGDVTKAMDKYATSLVAITDAKAKGDKRIDAVTAALTQLAQAAGPWGKVLGIAGTPLDNIIKDLSAIRTLHTLSDKVAAQDTAVQRLSRYLATGIRIFSRLDGDALDLYINNTAGQYYPVRKYYKAAQYLQEQSIRVLQNIAELKVVQYQLATASEPEATSYQRDVDSYARRLATLDPVLRRATRPKPPLTDAHYYAELAKREAFYKQQLIDPQLQALYQNAQRHLDAYYTEKQRNHALLEKCAATIGTWAQSHRALHISLNKARHHLLTKELFDQAQAIKKAVDDIQALKL